jgi:hypothetical protein
MYTPVDSVVKCKAVAEVATVIEMFDIHMFCRPIHHKYVDLLFFSIGANLQTIMGTNFGRKRSKKINSVFDIFSELVNAPNMASRCATDLVFYSHISPYCRYYGINFHSSALIRVSEVILLLCLR